MKKTWLASLALLLAACSNKDINTKEAVREAMVEYLGSTSKSTGIDPSAMDVNVSAVAFERDTARATVAFTVKGTDSGMQMNYTLQRKGDKWVVTGKDSTSGPHPIAGPQTGSEAAPPSAPTLPQGHPPVDSGTKK